MNKPSYVFAIFSTTSDAYEMRNKTCDEAKGTWLCSGCASPKKTSEIHHVVIKQKGINTSLNFISGVGMGVIREDLLQLLSEFGVSNDLILSTLLNEDGSKISGFQAFRPKKEIIIRGNSASSYRKCEVCGRHLYHPLGDWYVLRSQYSPGIIFGNQFKGLIVSLEIANQVKKLSSKQIAITKLPLLDAARDNLNLDLSLDVKSYQ